MEIKPWTYEEFPELTEEVKGAVRIKTTGDEVGILYHHDVVYGEVDGRKLHLQIMEPFTRNSPDRKWPALVFVQGSAWMEQNVYKSCAMMGNLVRRGYVVAVVQYRHSGIAPFPAQVQDTRNAVRFVRSRGEAYHADTEKIFVGGCSSGGHAALFSVLAEEETDMDRSLYPGVSARVCGVLDYYGAVNLLMEEGFPSTENHHLPDSPEGMEMGGKDLRKDRKLAERGTVECYIAEDTVIPPVMIIHGTKDRTVSVQQSISLFRKQEACRKPARLYLLEGADHGGGEFWTEEVCGLADAFMREICTDMG